MAAKHIISSLAGQFKSLLNRSFLKQDPLNEDEKFKDSVQHFCQQKRLRDVVQFIENQAHVSSAGIYVTILQLCLEKRALHEGKRVHAHIRGSSFVPGIFVLNKILELYCKCASFSDAQSLFGEMGETEHFDISIFNMGRMVEARKLFGQMPDRDNFSCTAMISCSVKNNKPENAPELFRTMQSNYNFECNKFTVSSDLAASAALQSLRLGKEINGHIIRIQLESDAVVWCALLDLYGKCV